MATKFFARLKAVDFYKKLPSDLSESTLAGAWISILAAIVISVLLGLEFFEFMQVQTQTELVVDRSKQGELLRINFNVSFPALSCEFATLDVSDSLGTVRPSLCDAWLNAPCCPHWQRNRHNWGAHYFLFPVSHFGAWPSVL
ncbi:unnamed protein product [Ostreobium quekettii]|uniref:Endoplasmic reticulum vesicle transporter N-terminal domain-containing protein n=1 Tax=Ostreobium quekettii TaxID=121088 RepID=A0A8S1INQ2_9CHLO|nr:unnamed protein product [Ostreobium quekettii]